MAEEVGALRVGVFANVAAISGDLDAIRGKVNSFGASVSRGMKGFGDAINGTLGNIFSLRGAMALLSGGAGIALIKHFVSVGSEITRTAASLGITTDALQGMRYAGELAGISTEELTNSLTKFARGLGEVKNGQFTETVTNMQIALGKLGLTVDSLKSLSLDKAVETLADSFKNIANPIEKASLSTALFGRENVRMVNYLNGGSAALRAAADEAKRFGIIIGEDTLKKAESANEEFAKIGKILTASGVTIAAEFEPAIRRIRDILADPATQNAIKQIAAGLNALFNVRGGAGSLQIVDDLSVVKAAIADTEDHIFDLRRVLDVYRSMGDKAVAAWDFEKAGDYNVIIGRINKELYTLNNTLKDLQDKKGILEFKELKEGQKNIANAFDPTNEQQLLKAVSDLKFKTLETQKAFQDLPEGLAPLLHGLGMIGTQALKSFAETGQLTEKVKELAEQQLKLNAELTRQDVKSPYDKYIEGLRQIDLQWKAGLITADEFNKKAFLLGEQLLQTTGLGADLRGMAKSVGDAFGTALDNAILEGQKFKEVMLALLRDIAAAIVKTLLTKPIAGYVSNLVGQAAGVTGMGVASAKGNVFDQGGLHRFASGGVIDSPAMFPFRGGMGLMGEAGPEAIMPLTRGPGGDLGVKMHGGGSQGGASVYIDARYSDIGVIERIQQAWSAMEAKRANPVEAAASYQRRFPTRHA